MRGLISVTLIAAGLAGSAIAHAVPIHDSDSPVRRRKSLGFGPVHPHAVFHSSPYQIPTNGFLPFGADSDPIEVARLFVEDHLNGRLTPENTFTIRKDSYTDKNTGVTHVYARQVVNGIEVADGDINVNVKDGMVLSYGDSVSPIPGPSYNLEDSCS
jgi:extracellular elastinolytic metalloproteinase